MNSFEEIQDLFDSNLNYANMIEKVKNMNYFEEAQDLVNRQVSL